MKCRFCQIIQGDKAGEAIIFENEHFLVLADKFRRTSVGAICLIIPKNHVSNILEISETQEQELIQLIKLISHTVQKAWDCKGVRVWTAINKEAGQSIFHCHIHIVACHNFLDRMIAAFSGIYDLFRYISTFGNRSIAKKKRIEEAEKLRKVLSNILME